MKLISVGFKNHKILGTDNEIMFFDNSRTYRGKDFVNLKYSLKDENKNYYTFLIGDNGSGKTILLKTIIYYLYLLESLGSAKNDKPISIDMGLRRRYNQHFNSLFSAYFDLAQGFIGGQGHILSDTQSQLIYLSGSPFENLKAFPLPDFRIKALTHDNLTHVNKYCLLKALSNEYYHDEILALNSYLKASEEWQIEASLAGIRAQAENKWQVLLNNDNQINIFTTIELFDNLACVASKGDLDKSHIYKRDLHDKFIYNDFFHEFFFKHRYEHKNLFSDIMNSDILRRINLLLSKAIRVDRNTLNITLNNENDLVFLKTSKIKYINSFDVELLALLEELNLIDIELSNGNRLIEQFSSGEQVLIRLFSIFANIFDSQKKENIIFLYDEPENSLHPRWQKEFISIFKEVAENIYKIRNSHFIFATHSPLIIQHAGLKKTKNISVIKLFKDNGKTRGEIVEDIYAYNIEELLLDEFSISYRTEHSLENTFSKVINTLTRKDKDDPLKSAVKSFELQDRIEQLLKDLEDNN